MIVSTRNVPISAHVTLRVREALRKYCRERGLSRSRVVHVALVAYLRNLGYLELGEEKETEDVKDIA